MAARVSAAAMTVIKTERVPMYTMATADRTPLTRVRMVSVPGRVPPGPAAASRPQLVHPERAEAAAVGAQAAGQLSRDQASALAALLAVGTTVTLVRAAAGTGKTRLVGTFAKAWTQAAGGAVHVVTVSENAARVAAAEKA